MYCRKQYNPNKMKNKTTVETLAVLDKLMCQGVIASRKDAISAIEFIPPNLVFCFLSNISIVKYNRGIVTAPNMADAILTEKTVKPKILMNGIDKYAYPAGVKRNDSINSGS